MIYCVNEDYLGNIWIGTNNGLNRFDTKEEKFEVFLESHGLPDPNVIGILVDDSGIL